MKIKLLALIAGGFISLSGFAQTTDLGGPISWKGKLNDQKQIPVLEMPGFDLQAIQAEDAVNDAAKDAPWRFGYKYETNISPQTNGYWRNLSNGDRLWRTAIKCEGAMTINLLMEGFNLPEGARIYLFDKNNTNRVGAYTSRNNRPDGLLGTELVHGDEIIVEYFEPVEVTGQGSFTISHVVHGYRSLDRVQSDLEKALNSSGDCNIDVHCPLGNGWEDQIRSVAMIVVGGSGICTGALINNSCDDGTPYFLTANHCLGGSTGNWAFRFNWASPPGTESCATTAGSSDPGPPYDQTANGATVLVSGGDADHALLEIDNMTVTDAQNWNLFYAGWNNDDTDGSITQATGIHHPSGDVMKICRENNSPYHNTAGGAAVWYIDEWEEGVTEPGSSGSPLFDQNGRIIGQLYGGAAACSGTVNNGTYDYYGRLGVSWGLGIGDYLDPASCGGTNTTNDGWDPSGPALPDDASIQSVESPTNLYCDGTIYPMVRLRNAGGNNLTSCVINYDIDGGTNQTYNWSGNLAPNGTEEVWLPSLTVADGSFTFNASTSMPNGVTDTDPANDAALSTFEVQTGAFETTITIETDCYGYENYWEVRDASSNLVASGGNSIGIAPGGQQIANNGDPDSYGDEMTINEKLCLAVGCYDFIMFDDWGDGMEGSSAWGCNTDGSYQITNASNTVLASIQNVNFGDSETNNFCVVDYTGLEENEVFDFSIYPNPNNGQFQINLASNSSETKEIIVKDVTGRIIKKFNTTDTIITMNLDNHSNGAYFITLKDGQHSMTRKFILRK